MWGTLLCQKGAIYIGIPYVGCPIMLEGCILYAWQWWGILNDLQGSVWQCCQDLCSFGCNCWEVVFGGPFLSINLKPFVIAEQMSPSLNNGKSIGKLSLITYPCALGVSQVTQSIGLVIFHVWTIEPWHPQSTQIQHGSLSGSLPDLFLLELLWGECCFTVFPLVLWHLGKLSGHGTDDYALLCTKPS